MACAEQFLPGLASRTWTLRRSSTARATFARSAAEIAMVSDGRLERGRVLHRDVADGPAAGSETTESAVATAATVATVQRMG